MDCITKRVKSQAEDIKRWEITIWILFVQGPTPVAITGLFKGWWAVPTLQ